jgi:glycosyltransferase involved in cell wall biosynthesis
MTPLMQIPRFTPWGTNQKKIEFQLLQNLSKKNCYIKEESKNKNKILMVAFHYPPQSGSSGLLRTLSFTKYLPAQGWSTNILTVKPIAFEECNNSLIDNIPTEMVIRRAQAFDAARHFSIRKKYPRLLALPDRWASWWLPALWNGMAEIKDNRPDFIWSTYPLASAHLIGACLAKLCKIPWIADFRDPMVSEDFPQDRLSKAFWKVLERHVFKEANACIFTTPATASFYEKKYPEAAAKIMVIENGYDEEVFENVSPCRYGTDTDTLLMLHSGIIYPEERDPSNFFAAVRELLDREVLNPEKLVIRFRAPVHGEAVISRAARLGLERCVEIAPSLSHTEAISEMMGADLLLIFQGTNFNNQVPAKLYEYLRSGSPIFGALDLEGETAKLMRQFKSLALGDINSIKNMQFSLEKIIRDIKSTETLESTRHNVLQVQKYSRRIQAIKMAESLRMLHEHL